MRVTVSLLEVPSTRTRAFLNQLIAFSLTALVTVSASLLLFQTTPAQTRKQTRKRTRPKEVVLTTVETARPANLRPARNAPDRDSDRDRSRRSKKNRNAQDAGYSAMSRASGVPKELKAVKARSFNGDLRELSNEPPKKSERPEMEGPELNPLVIEGPQAVSRPQAPGLIKTNPANPATANFQGLDYATWGAGHPLDANGDVGPQHYIQGINTSLGIFDKVTGAQLAAFSMNTFMSQGNFGNQCDTNNYGDPIVLYDSFEDRWIVTDFAFTLSGSVIANPPGAYECIAVSKTGDPVTGGWNFYSLKFDGGLGDYPKLGVWNDGIYMSVNMFTYSSSFMYSEVFAFNKAQMYAGASTAQIVSAVLPTSDFTLLPSNARLQTGTPPPGTPNYFVSTWSYLNALTVYKFHVDWERTTQSTLSTASLPLTGSNWGALSAATVAGGTGGNALDPLAYRAMAQNQYSNIGGVESLWTTHTVANTTTNTLASPRFYQTDVTGGTIGGTTVQAGTYNGDSTTNKFSPSIAVDRAGNMAIGYTATSATLKPSIRYAGRLAGDTASTITQTEQTLIDGSGAQAGTCGSSTCSRWGDYSAMTLDPDGCTFWYTNSYLDTDGLNNLTRIGSFTISGCTPIASTGVVSGTVTKSDTTPISGATVTFGSRTTTTDGTGAYSFTGLIPGTYNEIAFTAPGYNRASTNTIGVWGGIITTKDATLAAAPATGALIDDEANEFLSGIFSGTAVDGVTGTVKLVKPENVDQEVNNASTTGNAMSPTSWVSQSFTPAASGELTKVDLKLFCSGCSGTGSAISVGIYAASGNAPSGSELANATIPAFMSGAGLWYTATFSSPIQVTAGTQYTIVYHPLASPTVGTYASLRDSPGSYSGGQRCTSSNSGASWSCSSTIDAYFKTYVRQQYPASATMVSSLKDANPATGRGVYWRAFNWTANTPANTNVKFQLAASNSANGPFNFVGPDGTALTYFVQLGPTYPTQDSGLGQFNNLRYLRYKAFLESTDGVTTPEVTYVEVSYSTLAPTAATVSVSGKVTNISGTGVARTIVRLTDTEGNTWTATTNQFGNYKFENVVTGKMYFVDAVSREGRFETQTLNVTEDLTEVNFAPSPPKTITQPVKRLR